MAGAPPASQVGQSTGNTDLRCGTAFLTQSAAQRAQSQLLLRPAVALRRRWSACSCYGSGQWISCAAFLMTTQPLPHGMIALQTKGSSGNNHLIGCQAPSSPRHGPRRRTIHGFAVLTAAKAWMAGLPPAMTSLCSRAPHECVTCSGNSRTGPKRANSIPTWFRVSDLSANIHPKDQLTCRSCSCQ